MYYPEGNFNAEKKLHLFTYFRVHNGLNVC